MFLIPNLSISCLSLRPFLWVFSLQAQQKILDPTLLTISFQAVAEGNEDSSEPPLLQDKHPQLPQVFLRRSDLQMLDEPCCPFLDVVQLFKVLFEVGGSELNTLLHNANPSPSPAGYTVPDTGLHLSANLKNIFIYFLVFCLWNIKCSNAKLIQFLGRTFILQSWLYWPYLACVLILEVPLHFILILQLFYCTRQMSMRVCQAVEQFSLQTSAQHAILITLWYFGLTQKLVLGGKKDLRS